MKKNCYILFVFFLYCSTIFAQGESNIWYFGRDAGLDFNVNPPTPLLNLPTTGFFSSEGCSTISDSNGNLLFYTNGEKVWNKDFQIMLNGDNLAGHNSSAQSSAIIPFPSTFNFAQNRFDKYFLVTLDDYVVNTPILDDKGVRFSEVDMTMDNNRGGVTINKNIHLFGTTTTEKVCVVPHSNGCDYWVICKVVDSNDFYSYHISSSGFNTTPIISTTNFFVNASGGGQMKVSPNHKLLSYVVPSNSVYTGFYVFNFDNTTGIITEKFADLSSDTQYGTAFSPNSKILYKSGGSKVYQYDVSVATNADFAASKTVFTSSLINGLLSMQLGPDGKIYIGRPIIGTIPNYLSVINDPDVLGNGCNYVPLQQYLGGRSCLGGLPNQLNNLIPYNDIIIENENCNSLELALENNNNISSYNWGLAYANTPDVLISSSTESNPTFQFPIPNEEYIITCSVISDCYSKTYQISYFHDNSNYTAPIFDFFKTSYCQNQIPETLPSISTDGISGAWLPNSIDTSNLGTTSYTFTPNQGQCANPITIDITINSVSNINFTDISICEGDTVSFPSTNNINGIWILDSISNINSDTYTFVPDDECILPAQWTVTVNQNNSIVFEETLVCYGTSINFPNTNGISGTWTPTNISNTQSEIYTFSPDDTCSQPSTWQVLIIENDFTNLNISTDNNTIIANVDNANDFILYQLDNGHFQKSNIFENVTLGCHTINVTDLNGCNTISSEAFIFDYPKFFTPNNDGYNDFWNIILENTKTNLYIFDRYGKLLKKIHQHEIGWDGTYNGKELPSTDYWFVLEYEECGIRRTFKSHFSLIR